MKYDDIHPTIRQLIGCHEGLRKSGFPADNIFVHPSEALGVAPDEIMCFSLLRWRGKEFRIGCGPWKRDDDDGLRAQWTAAAEAVTSGAVSQADLDRLWTESIIYKDKVGFALALMNKGIVCPKGLE